MVTAMAHQADDHSPHSIDYPTSSQSFVPQDIESSPRHHSPTMSFQQPSQLSQSAQASSRPSSRMSGGGDRYGYTQPYQDQNREQRQSQPQPQQQPQQQQQQQPAPSKNSVGKPALWLNMWREVGMKTTSKHLLTMSVTDVVVRWHNRGQFYGEDHFNSEYRNYVFHLGLGADSVKFVNMLPLGRGSNKTAIPFLIGTKYDHFVNFPREDQEEISIQIFKIVLSKAFDLKCTIPEIENIGEPLLLYQSVN
ncbi:septum-promoting GTP-binding protein 1 [Histoplasma mississippiense (nom. inval.)]|uniref:septum-promoting GTP-binding protein 1 n=1 Tax=Ajellomyces capsulatus (strain NAm1 / WU24) TaxID=2059318 RepID=UPI000157BC15|nr:septum-promoting GTP-binding protein 1 [Histoplasma mississippiense (nom. inval.)]EDN05857.1 septum-promoting GTP-binding protein 1 [Histoplasma mississippiense (nom. inval.)]